MRQFRHMLGLIFALGLSMPAAAQMGECEIVMMPEGGTVADGQFADASDFLTSLYDGEDGHIKVSGDLPIRAVMCERENLVPILRDLPILKSGLPLSLSQDFDSTTSGLLTVYDAGEDFKAEYSGPKLSAKDEKKLRDTLEVFNFQKSIQ